jgi:hypothetical protein
VFLSNKDLKTLTLLSPTSPLFPKQKRFETRRFKAFLGKNTEGVGFVPSE